MKLLVNSTPIALWHDIIHEAEAACTISLKEEVEAYLVFLLARYVNKPGFVKEIIAYEFMRGLKSGRSQQHSQMQDVGDKCLLFSGLFPHIADKKLVKISYFVNIGQAAYSTISKQSTDLYGMLAGQFVTLMDVLQSIRNYSDKITDLLPLEAYELWNDVSSQRALKVLQQHTGGTPMTIDSEKYKH